MVNKNEGRENLPVAVIQNASLPTERQWLGTVEDIDNVVSEMDVSLPGIIVFGEVVAQHNYFSEVSQLKHKLYTN